MPRRKETRGRKKTLTPKQKALNDQTCRENWRKAHTKIVNVRFHTETDKEVLAKLSAVPNKTDYLRRLILEDIKKSSN